MPSNEGGGRNSSQGIESKGEVDKKYTLLCSKEGVKEPLKVFDATDFRKDHSKFSWVDTREPHAVRKKMILKEYPEIRELFGPEIKTLPIVLAIVGIQFFMAWYLTDKPTWLFLLGAYVVGATINHSLNLANHELSHDLCFEAPVLNRMLGLVCNLPSGIPSSAMFRRYHMWHHYSQGVDGIDTDIPSDWELRMFQSTFGKLIWASTQWIWYALRPPIMKPSMLEFWDVANIVVQFSFNYYVYQVYGLKALLYFVISALMGLSLHPCAGHFIAEHYEFVKGWETYSYIGILNYVNFNVGYHIEHHDFVKIPWSRIWKVREIAPEWYVNYPTHTSYVKVIYNFITDPNVGTWSRVKRANKRAQIKKDKGA